MLNKKDKKKYMKKYNKLYQKALGLLRKAHIEEFTEIFRGLWKNDI